MSTASVSNANGTSPAHAPHHKHGSTEVRNHRNSNGDANDSSRPASSTPATSVNSSGQTTGKVINVTA